jgi:hypothetical protein
MTVTAAPPFNPRGGAVARWFSHTTVPPELAVLLDPAVA